MRVRLDVVVWRGTIPESVHRIQAVAVDAAGGEALATERPDLVTTFRSAAKPFQLLPLVERGHADRLGLSEEDLAVMCASHTGSEHHVRLVEAILARLGLDASALVCGFHDPVDSESLEMLARHPERRSRLYNNCSGNHTGMLCLARSEGWPVEGYERAEHPVQRLLRQTVAEVSGVAPAALEIAVDGCGVVVFGLPLKSMALAYARFATARADGAPRERALARIRAAMRAYPRTTGGAGRLSTELMERGAADRVAKGGAEGVECLALPSRGLGVALKCEDGQSRGLGPAVLAVLEQLGALESGERERLADLARPAVRNTLDAEVGMLVARVRQLETVGG
jgi:L-asparaginase II